MNEYLLEMHMKNHGLSNEEMARRLCIDPATFYRKKKGISDFTRKELQKMRASLELSSEDVDAIFFDD